MTDYHALIAKLEAWREHDFHADRQLADEILLADDWRCEPDPAFEGGVRWFRTIPGGTLSSGETHRPHPIHDLNVAVGLVPYGMGWSLHADPATGAPAQANVFGTSGDQVIDLYGQSPAPTVALCIAAVKAIARKKGLPA